ncbi:unnamed protein product [Pleuronectes platessa]|uniref:Uncharacterized protein n=1 Tax=Pleuronectes platessa TaxID=8262 RepID=A0A9N7YD89_PLEPL|nr:unnamed protein product [Pleuronectes platessa]
MQRQGRSALQPKPCSNSTRSMGLLVLSRGTHVTSGRTGGGHGTPLSGGLGSSLVEDGLYAMQTRSSQDRGRRLAAQGQWDGTVRGDSLEKQGSQVHGRMDDICYTMFEVPIETMLHPPTPPPPPPPQQPPYSSRSGSTHSPRAHSMLPDRPGCDKGNVHVTSVDSEQNIFIFFAPA